MDISTLFNVYGVTALQAAGFYGYTDTDTDCTDIVFHGIVIDNDREWAELRDALAWHDLAPEFTEAGVEIG